MRIKNISILILAVVFILSITSGCNNSMPDSPEQPAPETSIPVQNQDTKWEIGEITDPVELEKLWQEYIYDSITTVCNAREFNSANEIDPNYVAKFCWLKYIDEYGKESLPLADKESSLRLLPLNTLLEYTQRYFDLTSLDISKIFDGNYDLEKQSFTFNFGNEHRPSYTNKNSWSHQLGKVTRNGDGTITAVMDIYDSSKTNRVELTKTLTLKKREDGSLFFASGRWDYINNHLVSLTGDYNGFDKITGFEGGMEELSMIGEVDGSLILAYASYEKERTASLLLVNTQTFIVEKKLEFSDNFREFGVKLTGDKIVVRFKNKIITVNKNLEQLDEIPLPKPIAELINREPKYDKNGIADIYFGGYDISSDLTKIAYSDTAGIKLFDTIDSSEKLLAETAKIAGNKVFNKAYHRIPRFVANDKKVITTMTGYDYSTGYTICDIDKGTSTILAWGESSTESIWYDTGLLNINAPIYDEKQTFDFETEAVNEIKLENTGDTGFIREPAYCYIGQNHGAIITHKWDANDNTNNIFHINRLDLNTQVVEENVISVKAAGTHILGVLEDGRIVFWYSLNPSESGICITK
ncbi:MAG: hypothetical protein JM58_18995 [Peptococcaceae bacterium BICA1-8]|nr:MAG: hypothetical protein JM58_18995 [Peptococcaceae bacterium BICA1-8]